MGNPLLPSDLATAKGDFGWCRTAWWRRGGGGGGGRVKCVKAELWEEINDPADVGVRIRVSGLVGAVAQVTAVGTAVGVARDLKSTAEKWWWGPALFGDLTTCSCWYWCPCPPPEDDIRGLFLMGRHSLGRSAGDFGSMEAAGGGSTTRVRTLRSRGGGMGLTFLEVDFMLRSWDKGDKCG